MVERDLAKVEVAGSSPVIRSIEKSDERLLFRLFCLFKMLFVQILSKCFYLS